MLAMNFSEVSWKVAATERHNLFLRLAMVETERFGVMSRPDLAYGPCAPLG
jgi:hypothetical protein